METDEIAFLQTIRAEPEHDTPRLVYADWLEEHDRAERAEFIRLQCALASLGENDPRLTALQARERKLWQKFGDLWRSALPVELQNEPFERGFVQPSNVEMTGEQFLSLSRNSLDAAPQWNVKLLLGRHDPFLNCHSSDLFGRLSGVSLHLRGTDPQALEDWLSSPHLQNLRTLQVQGHPFGISHVWAAASSAALCHLRRFAIICNHIGPEGAELIATSPYFRELEALDLPGCGIGSAGLAALSRSPYLAHLRFLNLQQNALDNESASALVGSRHLRQLQRLQLYGNHLGDEGARVLAFGKKLEKLSHLDLGLNRIGPAGARALADSPFLARIGNLYLGGNRLIGTTALDALRERFGDRVTI